MTLALAGKSPERFEIKSASLPMLVLRLKSNQLDEIERELQSFYGDLPGFFSDDPIVIDLSSLPDDETLTLDDLQRLLPLLREHALLPVGLKARASDTFPSMGELGLLNAAELRVSGRKTNEEAPPSSPASSRPKPSSDEVIASGALVVDRPLRSGQQVYARGRDLVLLAMVNPGSEVIADGHIHVYAPLRGRALAGARGWSEARIFAQSMQPELVSIAGVYRTAEEPLPDSIWGQSATVSLLADDAGDKLVFQTLGG